MFPVVECVTVFFVKRCCISQRLLGIRQTSLRSIHIPNTYASEDYQALLAACGIVCSMSRRGNCYDNAVMESAFSTVKTELADRFDSCGEAKMELFDYIEVFYNQRRRHSTLGQISPAAYERRTISEGMDAMENCTEPRWTAQNPPLIDTSNPAISEATETGGVLLCGLVRTQVGVDLGAPAPWSALEYMGVM